MKKRRLGLDLGTKSIGWCLLDCDEENGTYEIIDLGVRLFYQGNRADRRMVRAGHLQRRRKKLRLQLLEQQLTSLPSTPKEERGKFSNLYSLRSKALDAPLKGTELRAVLFQLAKRRGFRSNRKYADNAQEGAMSTHFATAESIKKADARTYGEFLYKLSLSSLGEKHSPLLRQRATDQNLERQAPAAQRAHIIQEFMKIKEKQESYFPQLRWDRIKEILFFQRDLKDPIIGKCSIYSEESRLEKASLSGLRFTMLQELSHLKILEKEDPQKSSRFLTLNEVREAVKLCAQKKETKYTSILKYLKLHKTHTMDLSPHKKESKGCVPGLYENVMGIKKFSEEQKEKVFSILCETTDDNQACELLKKEGLSPEEIEKIIHTSLPTGFLKFSRKAVDEIMKRFWQGNGCVGTIIHALRKEKTIIEETQEKTATLEYYAKVLADTPNVHLVPPCDCHPEKCPHAVNSLEKKYNRSPNGVLHTAFNQLQKVVNAIIARYGTFEEVVIELVRSEWDSKAKERSKGEKENDEIQERMKATGQRYSCYLNEKHKLFYQLEKENKLCCACPYCGRGLGVDVISSAEIEIDHILPYELTKSDALSNKTLCCKKCNAIKKRRTPFEAFGACADYDQILQRVPRHNRWRFEANALERYAEKTGGWQTRDLSDTSMIAKHARAYLATLGCKVWSIRGKMTKNIREHFRLKKDRDNDQRHHAQDAFIAALIDPGTVRRLRYLDPQTGKFDAPVVAQEDVLLTSFRKYYDKVVISNRRNHAIQGQLLDATAAGIYALENGQVQYRWTDNKGKLQTKNGPLPHFIEFRKKQEISKRGAFLESKAYQSKEWAYVDVWESLSSGEWLFEYISRFNAFQIKTGQDLVKRGKELIKKDQRLAEKGWEWIKEGQNLIKKGHEKECKQPCNAEPGQGPWRKKMRLRKGDPVILGNRPGAVFTVTTFFAAGKRIELSPLAKGKRRSAKQFKKDAVQPVHVDILGKVRRGGKLIP